MGKQKWNVHFIVRQSTTELNGEKIVDKKEARATIPMDFEQVMILMNMVNTSASFGLSMLDEENFKAIVYEDFDPACWNDYYVEKIKSVDFDEKEINIEVYNY